jgi:hypothetical protein
MSIENNPFIGADDHFKKYNENIDRLKNDPNIVAFDRLCYEVFEHYEPGKKLLERLEQLYLHQAMSDPTRGTYVSETIFNDGMRALIIRFMQAVKSHSQRIKAETNK